MSLLQSLQLHDLDLQSLEDLKFQTDTFLFKQGSGEDFTARYRNDPNFDDFVNNSVALKNKIIAYFRDQRGSLSDLIATFRLSVDNSEELTDDQIYQYYLEPMAQEWDNQDQKLSGILNDNLFPILLFGALSLDFEHNYTSKYQTDSTALIKRARDLSIKFGKDINETTQNMLVQQIKNSIALGESEDQMATRLNKILNNENRANLIAQDQSVRAYNQGRKYAAQDLGLTKKTWESSFGACPICTELGGQTIAISDVFPGDYDAPPAHPHCKCSIEYS